jgi:uncharacterized iron-regulated protein
MRKVMWAAGTMVALSGCVRALPPAPIPQNTTVSTTIYPATPSPTAPQASLPDLTSFILVRTDAGARTPQVMSVDQAADVLATYDVIFIGESHRHPGNHLAEMQLFRAIHARAPNLSLTMEQFERDVQPVLDDYLAGKIGENPFMEKARAWPNYTTSYRPLIEYAKEHKLPVIAGNAPEDVVRCVGKEGEAFFARMKPAQRGWVAAQLHTEDGPYKDKFMGFVSHDAGHGGDGDKDKKDQKEKKPPSESAIRSFAAQVTRDDTMAESIALHLQKNPGRKVVQINGSFHSDGFLGTVERLKLRMPNLKIAVVSPTDPDDLKHPTVSAEDAKDGTFSLLLRPQPDPYVNGDEMKAAVKRQVKARKETKCTL